MSIDRPHSDFPTLTPQRWQRLQELFERAVPLDAPARLRMLQDECAGDALLHEQVMSLLLATEGDRDLDLEQRVDRAIAESALMPEMPAGHLIGAYRIVRLLGRGGMGTVYLAERADEQYQQFVALKAVDRGRLQGEIAQRFRAERQILARLAHPNIARMLDGGQTDAGVPYLVMECIDGVRIDEYCRTHRLTTRARLRLMQQVCAGVQYAHQQLVVHRDLKPSNILVTQDGTPKLLDFGIAKLLDAASQSDGAPMTRLRDRILTPEYASPEQLRGELVGTAADIYSLGRLLYELLSDVAPFDLTGKTSAQMEQAICASTVRAPSSRLLATAQEPNASEVRARARELAGDLDNIVLRAMHGDPQRRYPSAAALADDIQNYLDDRPVQARPDAWSYRLAKFVRRNQAATVASTTVVSLIVILVAFYTARLAKERDYAELQAEKSAQVSQFLTDIFRVADPAQAQGRQITAVDMLDQGAEDIKTRLMDQPLVRANLLSVIGKSYKNLSQYEHAGAMFEESLAIRSASGREETREFAQTLYELANLRRLEGRFDESEQQFKRALDIQQRIFAGPHEDTAKTLTHLGVLYYDMDRNEISLDVQQRALEVTRAVFGENHAETADRMNNIALTLQALDRHAEAEEYLRTCLRIQADVLGPQHPNVLVTRYNLGLWLRATGRYKEAESLFRELLPIRRQVLGDTHPSVGFTLSAFGSVLTALGKFDEAERRIQEALDIQTSKLGDSHWRVVGPTRNLGKLDLARGDYPRALQRLRRVLDIAVAAYGESSVGADRAQASVAEALLRQGDIAGAARIIEPAYERLRAKLTMDAIAIRRTLEVLGDLRLRQGRLDEAAPLFEQVIANYERIGGPQNPDMADALLGLARIALKREQPASAISLSERALENMATQLPADHWRVAVAEVTLGRGLLHAGRTSEARALIEKGSKALTKLFPASDPRAVSARSLMGMEMEYE